MNVGEAVERHFEVLREVMATPVMDPTVPVQLSGPRCLQDCDQTAFPGRRGALLG